MAMMEADREALCGAKDKHLGERRAWRGGSASSRVTLGGRQVEMPRLRVRSGEGEVGPASYMHHLIRVLDALSPHVTEESKVA